MARGEFGPAIGTATINSIWQALNEADEAAARESASYAAAVAELNVLGDARGQRVLLAQEGLPLSMRMVLAIGAVVIVAFMYLLAVDDGRLHAVMTVSLAGLVALLLLLNYQLQRPFHGVVAIPATAMELVLNELEAEAGLPGMTSAGQPQ